MKTKISALVTVHNEEKILSSCLEKLHFCDEIVVILDKCSDQSKNIASNYTNSIYEGSWTKNGLNGFGTMVLNENNEKDGIYTGEFKDNKFHGQGKYQWHDGEIYEGEFANSEPNGNGTLTTPSGQKFSGKFKNSVLIN